MILTPADVVWCFRLFGFPAHYTDVGNLKGSKRRALLGKSWSVQVATVILKPLRRYFATTPASGADTPSADVDASPQASASGSSQPDAPPQASASGSSLPDPPPKPTATSQPSAGEGFQPAAHMRPACLGTGSARTAARVSEKRETVVAALSLTSLPGHSSGKGGHQAGTGSTEAGTSFESNQMAIHGPDPAAGLAAGAQSRRGRKRSGLPEGRDADTAGATSGMQASSCAGSHAAIGDRNEGGAGLSVKDMSCEGVINTDTDALSFASLEASVAVLVGDSPGPVKPTNHPTNRRHTRSANKAGKSFRN